MLVGNSYPLVKDVDDSIVSGQIVTIVEIIKQFSDDLFVCELPHRADLVYLTKDYFTTELTQGCNHKWERYVGLVQSFKYCALCDEKDYT